jgi:hypothetical protein
MKNEAHEFVRRAAQAICEVAPTAQSYWGALHNNSQADDFLVSLITIFGQEFWAHGNGDPLLQQWYADVRKYLGDIGVILSFQEAVPAT